MNEQIVLCIVKIVESSYHAFAVSRFCCRFKRFPVLGDQKTSVYFANCQFLLSKLCADTPNTPCPEKRSQLFLII